jgi:drug/metabolite transporter (DMT)-like permease
MTIPLLGIVCALVSMVTLGLAIGMSKSPTVALGVKRFILWRQVFTSSILFIVLVVLWRTVTVSWPYIALTLLLSFLSYVAILAAYQALKTGVIGVVSPITDSSAFITVAISAVFLGESFSGAQLAAIALTIFGIILFAVEFSDFKRSSIFNVVTGVPHALLACVIWGVIYAFYKIPVAAIGPILTAFLIEFGNLIAAVPTNLLTKTTMARPDQKIFFWIFIIGTLAAASTLFYNLGIQTSGGNVGIIASIVFCSPVIAALYGFLVYKERLNPKQWLALSLILLGIVGISIL